METKIKCVHCGESHFIRKGFRKTDNRGKIQVYKCLECSRKFSNDDGFYRMRNSPEKITSAIDLYFSNLSSRKVRNHFRRHLTHNSSHVTILDWCRRYTIKVSQYVDQFTPELSGQYYADETEIDRQKHKDIFWCSVDWGTRYINATHYSVLRDTNEAYTFINNVMRKNQPEFIQTDAFPVYPKVIRSVSRNRYRKQNIPHIVNNVRKTGKHNVRIETVFSKIKDRVNDFRGLKALWSAPILMQGIVLQHNWIEQHTTTGVIPAELAGLKFETGQNRWLGLIRLSSIDL